MLVERVCLGEDCAMGRMCGRVICVSSGLNVLGTLWDICGAHCTRFCPRACTNHLLLFGPRGSTEQEF